MMRRFTSAPKPAPRVRSYIVRRSRRAAGARGAVAHAVVARQVRARLGGGDDVVGRDGVLRVRQLDVDDRRAAARGSASSAASNAACARRRRGRRRSTRAARRCAGPRTPPVDAGRVVGHRPVDAVESRGSWPAIASSTSAASRHGARERADLVERRGEGDQAVARHAAVGRLQADDAAERRRLADRAAGVGAERHRRHAGRHRRRRPAARAARRRGRGPTGCADGPKAEFSVDEPIANSSQLVLPTMTAPARFEPRDDRGVVGRHEVSRMRERGGRADAARAEDVLDRDRHAGERQRRACARGRRSSAAARTSACSAVDGVEGVERRLGGRDPVERVAADGDG